MRNVVIIDNGGANIASLQFALERLECRAELTNNAAVIRSATHVILPGVGAAADSMARLRSRGLDKVIPELTQPVLGICLGMQLLYEGSEEGDARCLGAIAGIARKFAPAADRPVPHMGWNQLKRSGKCVLLNDVAEGDYAYFVHSYALPVGPETVAATDYGIPFSSVVAHRNFYGAQFHPERSAHTGALILRNFLALPSSTNKDNSKDP